MIPIGTSLCEESKKKSHTIRHSEKSKKKSEASECGDGFNIVIVCYESSRKKTKYDSRSKFH